MTRPLSFGVGIHIWTNALQDKIHEKLWIHLYVFSHRSNPESLTDLIEEHRKGSLIPSSLQSKRPASNEAGLASVSPW